MKIDKNLSAAWPLPAVLTWMVAWGLFKWLWGQGAAPHTAMGAATALSVAMSLLGNSWWRRVLIAAGFPLSLLLSLPTLGLAYALPAWAWLLPLGLLLAVYPLNAWRDAPLFPTPPRALDDLPRFAPLPAGACVLDAGCGLPVAGRSPNSLSSTAPSCAAVISPAAAT